MFEAKDISSEVFGKYQCGFTFAGFDWSDADESHGRAVPKWGSLSAPDKVRARYVPGFRLWQMLGLIPKGPRSR